MGERLPFRSTIFNSSEEYPGRPKWEAKLLYGAFGTLVKWAGR